MMKKCLALIFVFVVAVICEPFAEAGNNSNASPKIIATNPKNNTAAVDPSLPEITVTFNKPMMDKSWSWSYEDKNSYPQTTGQPSYTDNGTTCVLPVKLEPGKRYVIWINTARFKNFKDISGNAAEPYKLVFTTRQK